MSDIPELRIFLSRHHRTVSYTHHKEDKPLGRVMNKAKQSGVHDRRIYDNEIHILSSKISRKSRIGIVAATTLERFDHSLHIPRGNRGKNQLLR